MRVAIAYPPLLKDGQRPLLGQNRQFKYSHSREIRIYPLVPASAATLLKQAGHAVLYLDGINEGLTMDDFEKSLQSFRPDLLMLETKAPILRRHCRYLSDLKGRFREYKVVLVGDHVSFFPEQSLLESDADYVLTGGDYDVGLEQLAAHLERGTEAPKGLYFRGNTEIENTGEAQFVENLDTLPFIDRELTNWRTYGEAYLRRPCTYILSGRGCGGGPRGTGVCSFCVWQHGLWKARARLRSPGNVAAEISDLVAKYQVVEIFDDNEGGAVYNVEWLREFYEEMRRAGLLGKVRLSTNARADCLTEETCALLKGLGFRLLKVGLESGNDETLARLHKLESLDEIKAGVKRAKDHGLIVMLTTMVGYPWETEEHVRKTLEVARELMLYKTRAGDALQASVIVPYPGTPVFNEAVRNGWLLYDQNEYEKYDMSRQVLASPIDTAHWCKKLWSIHYDPVFVAKTLVSIRSLHDVALLLRGVKSLTGHTQDYREGERA